MDNIPVNFGEVRTILHEELSKLADAIKRNHQRAGQVASGRTTRSINAEVLNVGDNTAEGVVWGRSPFGTLETGRKGGKVPENFEAIILQWMHDKGISADRKGNQSQQSADRSFAWCVSRRIAKRGTKLYQTGGRADIYSNEIPNTIDRINSRLGAMFVSSIDKIHINSTKGWVVKMFGK